MSRTAVVTGAGRGIGRATALELARRGYRVLATMRDPAAGASLLEEAARTGLSIEVARLDVTDASSISLPETLDVLVNNAGVDSEYLPVEHSALDTWRRVFETNVFGLVEVTRHAIPALRNAGGGVICNVTSAGILFPMPFYAIYRASKAAVSSIGESLRAELAAFGIRVIEILPGPVETEMLAASDRLPEAASHDGYGDLAAKAWEGRRQAGESSTPASTAASRIADAIEDDAAPLRNGCDDMGTGLLEGWRATPDEKWMTDLLGAFGISPPGKLS